MDNPPFHPRSYEAWAPIYDAVADIWSGGAISAAGRAVTRRVRPGQSVYIAGVGGGRDAAALAKLGARLTVVDLSAAMLTRTRWRIERDAPEADVTYVHGNALASEADSVHDAVCAHYFLNVFGEDEVTGVLHALAALVRPGGLLHVADFTVPRKGHWLQWIHWQVPMMTFALAGLCRRHAAYDYATMLPPGWRTEAIEGHRIFGVGPRWHTSWTFRAPT